MTVRRRKESDVDMDRDVPQSDYLIGSEAIARHLGISSRRARYWIDEGVIPAIKARGTWIARRDMIDARFSGQKART